MSSLAKPHAPACDRNQDPILEVLQKHFPDRRKVLEIGSGTGQHAVHFAGAMPWLIWQPSDRLDALPGIRMWLDEAALPNVLQPLELDVKGQWPGVRSFDAVFTANTLHIMSWPEVEILFRALDGAMTQRCDAGGVRSLQLRREIHEREQRCLQRVAEAAVLGSERHPRLRSRRCASEHNRIDACRPTTRCRPTIARWCGSAAKSRVAGQYRPQMRVAREWTATPASVAPYAVRRHAPATQVPSKRARWRAARLPPTALTIQAQQSQAG